MSNPRPSYKNLNLSPQCKVLVLDWDENQCEVQLTAKQPTLLNESAGRLLSESAQGIVMNPLMRVTPDKKYHAHSAAAFARKPIRDSIYKPYFDLRKEANTRGVPTPVLLIIMTAASYTANELRALINQFYGDIPGYNGEFNTGGKFEVYVYNKENFIGRNENAASAPLKIKYSYQLPSLTADDFATAEKRQNLRVYKTLEDVSIYDPNKTILMIEIQNQIKTETGIDLPRKNFYLMDNAEYNTRPVEAAGFSSIVNPTTRKFCPDFPSFTQAFPKVLKSFADIFAECKTVLNANPVNPPAALGAGTASETKSLGVGVATKVNTQVSGPHNGTGPGQPNNDPAGISTITNAAESKTVVKPTPNGRATDRPVPNNGPALTTHAGINRALQSENKSAGAEQPANAAAPASVSLPVAPSSSGAIQSPASSSSNVRAINSNGARPRAYAVVERPTNAGLVAVVGSICKKSAAAPKDQTENAVSNNQRLHN